MSELLANLAYVMFSLVVSTGLPYLVSYIRSNVHSNDVAIYMEAAVNAAGRILLNVNTGLANGTLTKANYPSYINDVVKAEAVIIANQYIPQISTKLGKSSYDIEQTIRAKIGNQLDKMVAGVVSDGR